MKDVKSCLCGDTGVGKTTLVHRYLRRTFLMSDNVTIGASYQCRHVSGTCRLHLWDTAGQERYQALSPMYLRQGDIVLVTAEAAAPHGAARWIERSREANPRAVLFLVATKLDLAPEAPEAPEAPGLRRWAADHGIQHVHLVSSKTGEGCGDLFEALEQLAQDLGPSCPRPPAELPSVEAEPTGCCTTS